MTTCLHVKCSKTCPFFGFGQLIFKISVHLPILHDLFTSQLLVRLTLILKNELSSGESTYCDTIHLNEAGKKMLATILGDEVDQRLTDINPYSKAIESNPGSDFYIIIKIYFG